MPTNGPASRGNRHDAKRQAEDRRGFSDVGDRTSIARRAARLLDEPVSPCVCPGPHSTGAPCGMRSTAGQRDSRWSALHGVVAHRPRLAAVQVSSLVVTRCPWPRAGCPSQTPPPYPAAGGVPNTLVFPVAFAGEAEHECTERGDVLEHTASTPRISFFAARSSPTSDEIRFTSDEIHPVRWVHAHGPEARHPNLSGPLHSVVSYG